MKTITKAYQCDFCSKASASAGAMAQHERKCKFNPNNKHKCLDYCSNLEKIYLGYNRTGFRCKATGEMMYSFKAEYSSINIKGLVRMPLECKHHKYMSFNEQEKRFNM